MAGSSAAFSLELMAYYVLNSFGQACTTFVGQNYGAWKLERCKRTLVLTVAEDTIATAAAIALVLLAGRPILAIFNNDPQVIEVGYTRLVLVFSAYVFCMLYEVISRLPPGLWHLPGPRPADHHRRVRHPHLLDRLCLSPQPLVQHHHVCLFHQACPPPLCSSSWPCCGSVRQSERRSRGEG